MHEDKGRYSGQSRRATQHEAVLPGIRRPGTRSPRRGERGGMRPHVGACKNSAPPGRVVFGCAAPPVPIRLRSSRTATRGRPPNGPRPSQQTVSPKRPHPRSTNTPPARNGEAVTKTGRALLVAVITSAALVAPAGVAQAAEPTPTPTTANTGGAQATDPSPAPPKTPTGSEPPPISIQADGKFYIWADDCQCSAAFTGNSQVWPDYVRNKDDWVWNNGYVGGRDHVNIYWDWYYGGAYACISYGTSWWLPEHWQRFGWTKDGDTRGWGQVVHDNAASHRWVYQCGNNTW